MKVLCAPDTFKESLAAAVAAAAMATGVRRAHPSNQAEVCPVADGGEGTLSVLINALGGNIEQATVTGPLGHPVQAQYGVCSDGGTAIIELAQASGLALVPSSRRDPKKSTTFGTGQLMNLAAARGCDTIILCLGGSATIDGGAGIAQALGLRFFDHQGRLIETPITGGMLTKIERIDRAAMTLPPRIRVACDVTNPLCGPNGAAAVYGPQKGAAPEHIRLLDKGLAHLAALVGGDPNQPGAGAAGGAGFGLAAMCGGELECGIDLVLDAIGFRDRCQDVHLVLTGEGRLDAQSLQGKACMGVAAAAQKLGVPTIAIVGSTGPGAELCTDLSRGGLLRQYVSLTDQYGLQRAMNDTAALIEQVTTELTREAFQTFDI